LLEWPAVGAAAGPPSGPSAVVDPPETDRWLTCHPMNPQISSTNSPATIAAKRRPFDFIPDC
jgi:hypothetical protein